MGSLFGGGSDVQAPDYSAQIAAIKAAGEQAAKSGQFKPVTVTTSFGTPQYTYDEAGRLTNASYTPASWLQNLQQTGQGYAGQYQNIQGQYLGATQPLTSAQQAYGAGSNVYDLANQAAAQQAGLYGVGQEMYGLGRGLSPTAQQFGATGQTLQGTGADIYSRAAQALPTSYDTTQATQDYYNRMQQLVAPERERQLAQTRQGLFNTGRAGLAIGATQAGGQLATNPEMAAYYNAMAQQDLNLANQSEQQALSNLAQRTSIGQGLYNTGLQQYQAGLGAQQQGVGTTQAMANILGQGIGATQAGLGAGTSAANLYTSGTGLFGSGADLQNAYLRNITAAQVPLATSLGQLSTMETMAQSPLALGLQFGAPATQGAQYGATMQYNAANNAADLGVAQEQARVAAANANANQGSFWDSLGSMALTAGIGAMTGGLGAGLGLGASAAGGGLFGSLGNMAGQGLFSGLNLAGGSGTLSNLTPTAWSDVTKQAAANSANPNFFSNFQ